MKQTVNLDFKKKVYQRCVQIMVEKLAFIKNGFDEARESLLSESKSTAGDKHETGRAMIQLEQENLSRQMLEINKTYRLLQRIPYTDNFNVVKSGALVNTDNGTYFIGIGLGKIIADTREVFVISPVSPLARAMLGKSKGDNFSFNEKLFQIKFIC